MDRYVETAFKIYVRGFPKKIKCVPVADLNLDVGLVRSDLRSRGCLTFIGKKEGVTRLCFLDQSGECYGEVERICDGEQSAIREFNTEKSDVEKLVHESIRTLLTRKGYRVAKNKLVKTSHHYPISKFFLKYDAYRTHITHFKDDLVLAVDPAYKLEPYKGVTTESLAFQGGDEHF